MAASGKFWCKLNGYYLTLEQCKERQQRVEEAPDITVLPKEVARCRRCKQKLKMAQEGEPKKGEAVQIQKKRRRTAVSRRSARSYSFPSWALQVGVGVDR